jgi:ssDNA-binding Zn-finger/Zn-ribbon topoisomerase 1
MSTEQSPAVQRAMKTYTDIADLPRTECPHCKHAGLVRIHRFGWWFVKCHNCSKYGDTRKSPSEAVESWMKGELLQ